MSGRRSRKSLTFGELTSRKSLDFEYESHRLWVGSLEMVQRYREYTYKQGELRGIVGEERRGKETDRCPLTESTLWQLALDQCHLPLILILQTLPKPWKYTKSKEQCKE
jgi:hypothetical protein